MVRVTIDQLNTVYAQIKEHAATSGCSVFVLVAPDTDSLCACRILTTLLRGDNVSFKLKPVAGYLDIREATKETIVGNEELRTIIMLNCGNLVHTEETFSVDGTPLDLNSDTSPYLYMFDCHKPVYHTHVRHGKIYVIEDGFIPPNEDIPSENDSDYEFDVEDDSDEEDADRDVSDHSEHSDHDEDDKHSQDDGEDIPKDDLLDVIESNSDSSGDELEGLRSERQNKTSNNRREKRLRKRAEKRQRKHNEHSKRTGKRQETESDYTNRQMIQARRMKKRRWKNYYDGDYTGMPISYLMYRLAQQVNKDRNDLLWLAIVGLTDHMIHNRLDDEAYMDIYNDLEQEVVVHNADRPAPPGSTNAASKGQFRSSGSLGFDENHPFDGGTVHGGAAIFDEHGNWLGANNSSGVGNKTTPPGADTDGLAVMPAGKYGYITAIQEYKFFLHRHWSLYDAMYYSPTINAHLETWTSEDGTTKLNKLLAHCGIPLRDAKQVWNHMRTDVRNRVARLPRMCREAPEDLAEYRMELMYPSFTRQLDYNTPIAAADVSYAITALLECAHDVSAFRSHQLEGNTSNYTWRDNWLTAYNALSARDTDLLKRGLQLSMQIQRAIARVGPAILRSSNHITSTGPVRTVTLPELGDADRRIFTQPFALARLGKFLIDYHQISREEWLDRPAPGRRMRERDKAKPLVLFAHSATSGYYTVVGMTVTVMAQQVKTKLADVLRDAGRESRCRFIMDGFDQSCLWLHQDYYDRFREFLTEHMFDSRSTNRSA